MSVETVTGGPQEVRAALDARAAAGTPLEVVAATGDAGLWLEPMVRKLPSLGATRVMMPSGSTWPIFLRPDNLFNVANQIVVYAVIAIGMTMVIITGGIDLSVGSLVAVSAVVTALLISGPGGGVEAGPWAMVLASLGGIAACAAIGAFSGAMITLFGIPPFIATLGMMLVASGLAYIISHGQSIYAIPPSFTWLGRGAYLATVPNAAAMMALLYAAAHVVMARTRFGRYIYAVGGNAEAARLSGVPVKLILLLVYTLSGAMAGLGGVVVASQLKSGAPQYGQFYELYVIAAVVVGGTSLSGGSGKILGTLIGALIIAVIQNGMNLTDVEPYHQKVVMGLVILGAVLLDRLRKRGFRRRPGRDPTPAA
jgi:ribose transport system permease protein